MEIPKGVSYFKQFPCNFLVPYSPAIDATDDSKLAKYLKPFNCELLLRPAIFFSEFNATLAENCKILRQDRRDESGLLNGADKLKKFLKENEKLQKKMAPMGKECTEVATKKDVVSVLHSVSQDDETDEMINKAFEMGNALFSIASHQLAARAMLRNPNKFAQMVQTLSGADGEFKRNPTVKSMADFLVNDCLKKKPAFCSANRSDISNELGDLLQQEGGSAESDDIDDLDMATPSPINSRRNNAKRKLNIDSTSESSSSQQKQLKRRHKKHE